MKKIAILTVALAFVVSAYGQLGVARTVITSASGQWPAAVTNNTTITGTNNVVVPAGAKDVCIQLKTELSDTGTAGVSVNVNQSVDGTSFELLKAVGKNANGTTAVVMVSNITVNAAAFLRFDIFNANANTGFATNYTVKVNFK